MTTQEIQEAQQVFGESLDTGRVVIHENAGWTNFLGRVGAWLRGEEPPAANAVTLLNHVYFPRRLPVRASRADSPRTAIDTGWLIHELTHVWQFQNLGLWYVLGTVWLHVRSRHDIYSYGGEAELRRRAQNNEGFLTFNPEQQGEISRDYYVRIKRGLDAGAWEPFVKTIQEIRR